MIIIELIIGILVAILMRKILTESDKQFQEQLKQAEPVKIMVEVINDTYYGWMFEENEFILQSSSKEDFINKLKQKFPDRNLNLLSKEKITWLQENYNKN